MCGIAAVFAYDTSSKQLDGETVTRMCARMTCRGPDGSGTWAGDGDRVTLGHRRLAVIDLSDAGAQPMTDVKGTIAISFNGEIYNYRALRRDLESRGHYFRSSSDTEVLLHLYLDRGVDMMRDLRGMFAFALWDGSRRGMLLARDPFGIKPLYYSDDGKILRAASEVKALLAGGGVDTRSEPAGQVGFFLWGNVPEPFTLFRGIRTLPAGSTLWVDEKGARSINEYTSVTRMLAEGERTAGEAAPASNEVQQRLRNALVDSVRHHLVADVDVGVFLSAGLDSTTLTALASEGTGRLRTVTLGFEEYRGTQQDETPLAEAVARHYGTDHQTVWITRGEFQEELNQILDRMDQPSIDGVNSYFVARAAKQVGLKVALSGLGGDELFGGYPSFREIPRLVSMLRRVPGGPLIGRQIRGLMSPFVGRLTSPKYAGVLEYGGSFGGAYLLRRGLFMPWELGELLDHDLVDAGLSELATLTRLDETVQGLTSDRFRVSAMEASWYMRNQLLRDTDWASMTHSLEVRVPLVDPSLWETVAALLHRDPRLGKRAMALTPIKPLPAAVMERAKTGFHVPTGKWIASAGLTGEGTSWRGRGLRDWARYVYQLAA